MYPVYVCDDHGVKILSAYEGAARLVELEAEAGVKADALDPRLTGVDGGCVGGGARRDTCCSVSSSDKESSESVCSAGSIPDTRATP